MQASLRKGLGLAVGLLVLSAGAQATLISYQSNGVDLVYDDDYTPVGASSPGLTWTADANLFLTQYTADNNVVNDIIAAVPTVTHLGGTHTVVSGDFNTALGLMTWFGATAWSQWLSTISYGGANDWRLSSALNSDGSGPCGPGFNCTDSELGHLFYIEGGLIAGDAINDSPALTNVFTNMQDFAYGSSTESSASQAWSFFTSGGIQNAINKTFLYNGWAVRPGRVATAPLPGTAALMTLGLLVLGARRLGRQAPIALR